LSGILICLVTAALLSIPWYWANVQEVIGRFQLARFQNPNQEFHGLSFNGMYYPLHLVFMVTLPGLALFVAGIVVSLWKRRYEALSLLWLVVPPLLILTFMPASWPRYLAPALPAVAVISVASVSGLSSRAAHGKLCGACLIVTAVVYGALISFVPVSDSAGVLTALFMPRSSDLGIEVARPHVAPTRWCAEEAVMKTIDIIREDVARPICFVAPYTHYDFNREVLRYLARERYPGFPFRFTASNYGYGENLRVDELLDASYIVYKPTATFITRFGVLHEQRASVTQASKILNRFRFEFPRRFERLLEIPQYDGVDGLLFERNGAYEPEEVRFVLETAKQFFELRDKENVQLAKLHLALGEPDEMESLRAADSRLSRIVDELRDSIRLDSQGRAKLAGPRERRNCHVVWGMEARKGGGGLSCLEDKCSMMVGLAGAGARKCVIEMEVPEGLAHQSCRIDIEGCVTDAGPIPTGELVTVTCGLPDEIDTAKPLLLRFYFSSCLPGVVKADNGYRLASREAARLLEVKFI
jgi:hypothetical protein